MPKRYKRRKRKVAKKMFKKTSVNKSHRHKWMRGRTYTTINARHKHKINIRKMIALRNKTVKHSHRLLKK